MYLNNGRISVELFTVFLYQTLFSYIFTTTLWCEISKKYKDCFLLVVSRLFIMIISLLSVFEIYNYIDNKNYILMFLLYPFILYLNYLFIYKQKDRYYKTVYNKL